MTQSYTTIFKSLCLALAVAGSSLLGACDSYLDIQPVGKVIPNSLEEYRATFTTAYGIDVVDRALCEMRTDEATLTDDATDLNSYKDIATWNDNERDGATASFGWSNYYKAIYYANAVIDKQDEITGNDRDGINQLVGEAYLMRGYLHFILANLYGEPYTTEGGPQSEAAPLKLSLDLEEVPVRATVEKLYQSVLDDIESARGLLNVEEWEEGLRYRFSTRSVDALESRVRLYMGNWQEAYNAAERVLAQKSDLVDFNSADAASPCQYQSVEMITAYERIQSSGTVHAVRAAASFLQTYRADDLRPAIFYGEADEAGNRELTKLNGLSEFRCSFRTGELYLNAAEAAARLDKLSEARTRLLQLMEKRYTPEGYAALQPSVEAMNQEALIGFILEERARELAFEGHRWFDLRRTTRPRLEKTLDGETFVLQQDDARYTLRIPLEATEANPNL